MSNKLNLSGLKVSKNSNGLMILSFLLIGAIFILFFVLIEAYFWSGLFSKAYALKIDNILLNQAQKLGLLVVLIAMVYGIGFVLYCLSLPFIAAPACMVFTKLKCEPLCNKAIIDQDDIHEKIMNIITDSPYGNVLGFMYLRLRVQNSLISDELKFLFNQIMFARSCLAALVFAAALQCLYLFSFSKLALLIVAYIVSLVIYCFCLKFWDRALYNCYVINKLESPPK